MSSESFVGHNRIGRDVRDPLFVVCHAMSQGGYQELLIVLIPNPLIHFSRINPLSIAIVSALQWQCLRLYLSAARLQKALCQSRCSRRYLFLPSTPPTSSPSLVIHPLNVHTHTLQFLTT